MKKLPFVERARRRVDGVRGLLGEETDVTPAPLIRSLRMGGSDFGLSSLLGGQRVASGNVDRTVALIEDSLPMALAASNQISSRSKGAARFIPVPFTVATKPPEFGDQRSQLGPELLDPHVDVVLLDLVWRQRPQDGVDEWDRATLLTEGLRLLGLLLDRPDPPSRIVCYSAALSDSSLLNIAFREPVAERLGCSVLELPPSGVIQCRSTEVLYFDAGTLTDDEFFRAAMSPDPRHTRTGPNAASYRQADVSQRANLTRALLAIEGHRAAQAPHFAAGEILATWCREPTRTFTRSIPNKAKYAVRDVAERYLDMDPPNWLVARQVLRRVAGYGLLA